MWSCSLRKQRKNKKRNKEKKNKIFEWEKLTEKKIILCGFHSYFILFLYKFFLDKFFSFFGCADIHDCNKRNKTTKKMLENVFMKNIGKKKKRNRKKIKIEIAMGGEKRKEKEGGKTKKFFLFTF